MKQVVNFLVKEVNVIFYHNLHDMEFMFELKTHSFSILQMFQKEFTVWVQMWGSCCGDEMLVWQCEVAKDVEVLKRHISQSGSGI